MELVNGMEVLLFFIGFCILGVTLMMKCESGDGRYVLTESNVVYSYKERGELGLNYEYRRAIIDISYLHKGKEFSGKFYLDEYLRVWRYYDSKDPVEADNIHICWILDYVDSKYHRTRKEYFKGKKCFSFE